VLDFFIWIVIKKIIDVIKKWKKKSENVLILIGIKKYEKVKKEICIQ
jgi:hypothetical protein